jgi:hypothetical protein
MSLMQAIWPDCRFIHMVRHGMDIAQSMARHPAFRVMAASNATNWVPLSYDYWPKPCLRDCMPDDFVRLWRFRLEALLAEEQRLAPGSLARMKFEDLIADPRGFIETLCGFLSLETDAAWLDRAESQVDRTRFANRKTPIGRFFGPGDRRLLSELGY